MILCDEIFFEITVTGAKSDVKKFIKYLKGGAIDDVLEFSSEYIHYDDDYDSKEDDENTWIILANDDFGFETDSLDTDDLLDPLCRESEQLDISGHVYDVNDDEYEFKSVKGSRDYVDSRKNCKFNDELDALRDEEYDDEY